MDYFLRNLKLHILAILYWLGIYDFIRIDLATLITMVIGFLAGLGLTLFNIMDNYVWSPPDVVIMFISFSVIRGIIEIYYNNKLNKKLKAPIIAGIWTEIVGIMIVLSMAHNTSKYDTWNLLSTDSLALTNAVFLSIAAYQFVAMLKTLNRANFIPDSVFKNIINRLQDVDDFIEEKITKKDKNETPNDNTAEDEKTK